MIAWVIITLFTAKKDFKCLKLLCLVIPEIGAHLQPT